MTLHIEYRKGDLLASNEPVIAHGCNCRGVMGAGIAAQVATWYPDVLANYKTACSKHVFRVGTAQPIWTGYSVGIERCVVNLGTQKDPGKDASAWAVFLSFANLAEWAHHIGVPRVAIPRIGAGIGGLSWDDDVLPAITEAMDRATKPLEIVVYDYTPSRRRKER
jgi:O-acetyl-ADP-ribose deacetylase (regulator of RNase III)